MVQSGPAGGRGTRTVSVELEAVELVGKLANETTYNYWTFNGKVPGPFLRVRVGDTVRLTLKNRETSRMIHSVDLHAVTGPGGGAVMTPPGEAKTFRFKALNPGLYVYHCATPMVANHITSGMYGLILVEPQGGLPKVDREFYVMQDELYTDTDIARAVRETLTWDVFVPDQRIQSTVWEGIVTLEGTVDLVSEREDAERAIRNLVGVRRVISKITVVGARRPATPPEVRSAIEAALERRAQRKAQRIRVDVNGGRVALAGRVRSWEEKRAVLGAARYIAGVEAVEDGLLIDPRA